MRFRVDSPQELTRARAAVSAWREEHPDGTGEQLVAALGGQFHRDYGAVLRVVFFAADQRRAHEITRVCR